MPAEPLVSIVIPVFNGADFLRAAIESALAQTYPATEVLVVDDGSDDGGATQRIAAGFGPRIRYLHKPNGGVATALNRGIDEMRGELFSWLSHDDLYRPHKVARQVAAWRASGPRSVVVGDFDVMDEAGVSQDCVSLADIHLPSRPLDAILGTRLNGCAMLIPRAVFAEVGRFDPGLPTTQDYALWLRMAHRVPFVHVAAADTRHRRHAGQGSRAPAHIREAERLFQHALSRLPRALMVAYEGSEIGFLLRQRDRLAAYPAVLDYIDRRVASLCDAVDYACVLATAAGSQPPEDAVAAVGRWRPAPRQVLAGAFGAAGVRRAFAATTADRLLVVAADRLPDPLRVRDALIDEARRDADVVFLEPAAGGGRPVADLLVRRSAGPALRAAMLDASTIDRACLDGLARVATLAPPPGTVGTTTGAARSDIRSAFAGRSICDFHGRGAAAAILAELDQAGGTNLPRILFVAHDLGGGTVVHLRQLDALLRGRALPVFLFAAPSGGLRLSQSANEGRHGVAFHSTHQYGALRDLLARAGLARADVVHAMGVEETIRRLLADLAIPYDATLVDYDHFATSPHLDGADGRFVGDDAIAARAADVLRPAPGAIAAGADRVIAISRDLAHRVAAIAPGLPLVCAAHWARSAPEARTVLPLGVGPGESLRVLLVGLVGPTKGSRVLAEAVRIVRTRGLPIQFHLVGGLDPPLLPIDEVLTVESMSDFSRLPERFASFAPHVAWHPAQVPETWSYALSAMMEAGLPVAAGAIGALVERCAGRDATWLLPWDSPAENWVDLFLQLHATGLTLPPRWAPVDHLPPAEAFYPDTYLAPAVAAHRGMGGAS